MFTKNALKKSIFLLITIVILAACVPQASNVGLSTPVASSTQAQPTQAQSTQTQPITLRLATYDDNGAVSTPYINEFANQVATLSGGNITIVPSWAADTEQNVLKAVIAGQYDLGLVASRAWDTANITSFQALQAPFLISNDALAIAVATSDIAHQMLGSLSSAGIVGLTLWPEDLRHPFSVDPAKPLLSPADFTGLTMRVPPSAVSDMLIKQLGASPMYGDSGYQGAESGLTQLGTLNGRPIATGNVTFYPKYQVLFVNGAAFKKLSTAQQKVLSDAAAAAQKKAISEHTSDAAAGTAWCADGSSIVLASAEQIAAFEKAAQPVFDSLNKDSFNAKMIAAINDLKAKTPASAGAQACQSTFGQTSPQPTASGTEVWSTGTLPNGVWTVKLSADDLFQMGDSRSVASDWAGTYTVPFEDGNFQILYQGDQGDGKCQGTYAVVGSVVRLTYTQVTAAGDECPGEIDNIQWRLDSQGLLHIHLVDAQNVNFGEDQAFWEAKPFQPQVAQTSPQPTASGTEVWSNGTLPNGVWTMKVTTDELVQMGLAASVAKDWYGTYHVTFQDGNFTVHGQDDQGNGGTCPGTYAVVGDVVRLTYTGTCVPEVDDIQWRLDDQGLLHIHLIDAQGIELSGITAMWEAKPWQKVQ